MEKYPYSLTEMMEAGVDFLNIVITKDEVLKQDISTPMKILEQLIASPNTASYFMERVDIAIDGYNERRDELWEIPEVRDYVVMLDAAFPYWLYFLSKNGGGLYVVVKCFLLPFLTPEGEKEINLPKLDKYLTNRGFPAMNQVCEYTDLSEEANIEMTNRVVNYFIRG